jgi:hypothetical protein
VHHRDMEIDTDMKIDTDTKIDTNMYEALRVDSGLHGFSGTRSLLRQS